MLRDRRVRPFALTRSFAAQHYSSVSIGMLKRAKVESTVGVNAVSYRGVTTFNSAKTTIVETLVIVLLGAGNIEEALDLQGSYGDPFPASLAYKIVARLEHRLVAFVNDGLHSTTTRKALAPEAVGSWHWNTSPARTEARAVVLLVSAPVPTRATWRPWVPLTTGRLCCALV